MAAPSDLCHVPESFRPVDWRGTLRACPHCGDIGISFDREDGTVLRLRLNPRSAQAVMQTIRDYVSGGRPRNSHSPSSVGMPSADVSTKEPRQVQEKV